MSFVGITIGRIIVARGVRATLLTATPGHGILARQLAQKAPNILPKDGILLSETCVKRLQDICQSGSDPTQYLRITVSIPLMAF
jgi:hypothetical protein